MPLPIFYLSSNQRRFIALLHLRKNKKKSSHVAINTRQNIKYANFSLLAICVNFRIFLLLNTSLLWQKESHRSTAKLNPHLNQIMFSLISFCPKCDVKIITCKSNKSLSTRAPSELLLRGGERKMPKQAVHTIQLYRYPTTVTWRKNNSAKKSSRFKVACQKSYSKLQFAYLITTYLRLMPASDLDEFECAGLFV